MIYIFDFQIMKKCETSPQDVSHFIALYFDIFHTPE